MHSIPSNDLDTSPTHVFFLPTIKNPRHGEKMLKANQLANKPSWKLPCLNTNMSAENPWLEDVFPIEVVPF